MNAKNMLRNQEGFTLVEIIAVLIILGILAAVAVPRYIDLEQNAKNRAIDAAISELNGRESLTWADAKISNTDYQSDASINDDIVAMMVTDLGDAYRWQSATSMNFKGGSTVNLTRTAAQRDKPGNWARQ